MPEFDMEAFVKYGNVSEAESSVTALVKNREGSRHVTVADALSCELTVYLYARIDDEGTTEETSLQFFRDIADIAPGSDWGAHVDDHGCRPLRLCRRAGQCWRKVGACVCGDVGQRIRRAPVLVCSPCIGTASCCDA